jgi:ATP-dependent Lon protease
MNTEVNTTTPSNIPVFQITNGVFFPNAHRHIIPISPSLAYNLKGYLNTRNIVGITASMEINPISFNQAERIGIAAEIIEVQRHNDVSILVTVPFARIDIKEIPKNPHKPFCRVAYIKDQYYDKKTYKESKILFLEMLDQYCRLIPDKDKNETIQYIQKYASFENLLDAIISICIIKPAKLRQFFLNIREIDDRIIRFVPYFQKVIETLESMKAESSCIKQTSKEQATIKNGNSVPDFEAMLENKVLPQNVLEVVESELSKLKVMPESSSEYSTVTTYLNHLFNFPWQQGTEDISDLRKSQRILDESHFGLQKPKNTIIEYLGTKILSAKDKGNILCFVGPPGIGKTSIAKAVAEAMGRKFIRFSLGGLKDEAEIKGHRRTYVGALPGNFVKQLSDCKSNNPVFCLDEIDKINSSFKGDPSSALLEALDPEQNHAFADHYMEVPIDLSKVFFVCTANDAANIAPPLLDRMEVIDLHSYTAIEKRNIAQKFLVPKQLEENGLENMEISFQKNTIDFIIEGYTNEAGVRKLEKCIKSVCRKIATMIVMYKPVPKRITPNFVEKLLGSPLYRRTEINLNDSGEVIGLAFTQNGGRILPIQVSKTYKKGVIETTGSLGDVMKESTQIAVNLAERYFYEEKDVEQNRLLKEHGIQIHAPEGAVPKDGPSAGAALFTAVYSKLSETKVRPDIAMTGEIDTFGRVTKIGGTKEKIIAAYKNGIKNVILPEGNQFDDDIRSLPPEVEKNINLIFVNTVDEVLQHALCK